MKNIFAICNGVLGLIVAVGVLVMKQDSKYWESAYKKEVRRRVDAESVMYACEDREKMIRDYNAKWTGT